MRVVDVRRLGRDERADFAAFLATLPPEQWQAPTLCTGWQAPTLCTGWRVRDVVAHVVSYDELGMGQVVRGWFWSPRINAIAMARYNVCSPEQLLALLAAHLEPQGLHAALGGRVGLVECIVHHQDIRRGLGLPRVVPAERLLPALRLALIAPDVGWLWRVRGVRLVATDVGFSFGAGPVVRGPGEALLMALAGRHGVVGELAGPGQGRLARRIGG